VLFVRSSVIDDEDQLFSLDEDAPIDSLLYRTTARYRNDDEDEEENDEEGEDEAGDTDGQWRDLAFRGWQFIGSFGKAINEPRFSRSLQSLKVFF
jgi:hypothetical protein